MRFLAGLALACALAGPVAATPPAPPRPYTVEDLLAVRNFGRAAFSGDGRTAIFEVQGPITAAGQWDLEFLSIQRTSRLYVVDVERGGPPKRLLRSAAGGETLGAVSPDGRRALVYRLVDHTNELGVLDFSTRTVSWSGRAVDAEAWLSLARWRNNTEVVFLATTADAPSMLLNQGWQSQARTIAAWKAAQAGQPSVVVLRGGPGAEQNPTWPQSDVVLLDARTGATKLLTRGPFMELSIAPGGESVALISADEPVTMDGSMLAQNGLFDRRRRLMFIDLRNGRIVRPCPRCDLAAALISWAPDGGSALVVAQPDDAKSGDWRRIRYWRLSTTGAASAVSEDLSPGLTRTVGGTTALLAPDAGWVDGAPAIFAHRAGETAMAWWTIDAFGARALASDLSVEAGRRLAASPHGFLVRTPQGVVDLAAPRGPAVAGPQDKVLAASALAGELPKVLQIEDAGGARLLTSTGVVRSASPLALGANLLAVSPAASATLSVTKTANGVGTLWLARPEKPSLALMALNAALADVDLATPRPIVHRTPRGQTVTSWLYTPGDHKAGDDRPLVVVPYPGSNYASPPALAAPDARGYTANVRLLVGAGYAVLVPSLPIPADAPPQEGLAEAMLMAVDATLAADPGLSAKKLAVWGHSFGGYGALVAATQTARFKAVIASSGVSDMFSYWAAQGPAATAIPEVMLRISTMFGWAETGQGRMGGPPWAQPQRYIDGSPLLQADKITAPVLLIQGDLDYDPYKSMAMFAALYRQGKPVELLTYPGEGHVVQSPGNVRDVYARAFAFLQAAFSAVPGEAGGTATAVSARLGDAAPASQPSQ
ncbi:MAG: S9 family peptidase [Caulobacter sp.]|nr:S9 family peptidase [Caulobacter sp.]